MAFFLRRNGASIAVNLDVSLAGDDALLQEEVADLEPLVTGKLNNKTVVGVVNDVTTALERLLKSLGNSLQVEVILKTFDNGNALAAVTLYNAKVNVVLCVGLVVELV